MAAVYAVGVGPGDPELVTRKAERILRSVDVILAPVSNPAEASVALGTIREFIDESRQEIIVHQFPMTADRARLVPAACFPSHHRRAPRHRAKKPASLAYFPA